MDRGHGVPGSVTLTIVQGQEVGRQFVFEDRTTCIIGRDVDCQPRIPNDDHHRKVSRTHCLLDINPPDVRVRDFGSRNGTYVNGMKIGQRERYESREQGAQSTFPEHDLEDGDEIRLGQTALRVTIHAENESNQPHSCVRCGKDVTVESVGRPGDYVCKACRARPTLLAETLLGIAVDAGGSPGRWKPTEAEVIEGYNILHRLGEGGMGAVYLARHRQSGELVAVKLMLPEVAVEETAKQMFLREVENTRSLRHPNIVKLGEGGCIKGVFYFTMEYCDGGSVERLLQANGKLAVDVAVPIISHVLEGLEYAHAAEIPNVRLANGTIGAGRGLIHRDLKPANLFLSESERLTKIGDFGLAKAFDLAGLSGQTCTGSSMGTLAYMPRLQVFNFKYARPDVDVWAAAATLYHMLTGVVPRDFPKGKDPFRIVLDEDAVPIRKRGVSLPAKLAEVIDLALREEAGKPLYFQSAGEFRKSLLAAV